MYLTTRSCGLSFVVPEQPAKARMADDLLTRLKRIIGLPSVTRERPVANPLMRAERVVEVDVGSDQQVKMLLSKKTMK